MERALFKNNIANIIIGAVLVLFAVLSYILDWVSDFVGIITGAIIIIYAVYHLFNTIKYVKNSTTRILLLTEVFIDVIFGVLAIMQKGQPFTYIGVVMYLRGVNALIISNITKKSLLLSTLIGYILVISLGLYVFFDGASYQNIFELALVIVIGLVGMTYLYFGITRVKK